MNQNFEFELMTQKTKNRLEQNLKEIQAQIAMKNTASGEALDNSGDWHDNAARDVLFQELQVLGKQEKTILEYLANPQIILPRQDTSTVDIGNTVEVIYEGETQKEEFTILGVPDSQTDDRWISYKTPLAQKLIGKRAGEQIIIPPNQAVTLISILVGKFE